MATVKEVEALNSKIEKINVESTKIKTTRELLQKRLEQELKDYKEQFGVDLLGSTLEETINKFKKESESVSAVVQKEYELKLSVVKAIEDGDYAYANKLLGIEAQEEDFVGFDEAVSESDEEGVEEPNEEYSDVDVNLEVEESENTEDGEDTEDEEEEDFGFSPSDFMKSVNNISNNIKGSSVEEATKEVEKLKEVPTLNIGDIEMEDDDDDIDDDFGFGDMLSGTKFEV